MHNRIHNFSAGPAVLPEAVLEQAKEEMLNYRGTGMSVMEMSHRSKEYLAIFEQAEAGLRRVLNVPEEYAVLFLQGGASTQFAMVPMNLYLPGHPVNAIHTGSWTKSAITEFKKVAECTVIASAEESGFTTIPALAEIVPQPDASFVYLCSNNTIKGTQWHAFPHTGEIPLVADMSSDILSRPIDVSQFGLIFAGAQKNIGPAGVTIVIMRKELAERAPQTLPTMLQYRTHISQGSMYNTPPTYAIYMVGLVVEWLLAQGGLAAMAEYNQAKANVVYQAIDRTDFYTGPVVKEARSLMNVVFRIQNGNEALEKRFAAEAEAAGLSGLKGHRSVGGLRASIYNAQTMAAVNALAEFMQEFEARNG